MQSLNIPVLFVVFNRPEYTKKVFERIRSVRPAKLYVAADGPRLGKEAEFELCDKVRKIATNVDWPCQVHTLFREQNLGCGHAVSEAITWFFSQVEMGVVLEDDCLPDPSFFYFCEKFLKGYKDEPAIMHVNGTRPLVRDKLFNNTITDQDNFFISRYPNIWGWASWSRAWKHYSFDIHKIDMDKIYQSKIYSDAHKDICKRIYEMMANPATRQDTWDFQWLLSFWAEHGFSVIPRKNLIKNLGFGMAGTHPGHNLFFDRDTADSIDVDKLNITRDIKSLMVPEYDLNILKYSLGGQRNRVYQLLNIRRYLMVKLGMYK